MSTAPPLPAGGNEPLPPGWQKVYSQSRDGWYYYNEGTGESTWELPTDGAEVYQQTSDDTSGQGDDDEAGGGQGKAVSNIINPDEQLDAAYDLIKDLNGPWKDRIDAMKCFAEIVTRKHAADRFCMDTGEFVTTMERFKEPLALQIKDRRSAVCKDGCASLMKIVKERPRAFIVFTEFFFEKMFDLLKVTVKVINQSADETCKCILRNVQDDDELTILQSLINGTELKSPSQRQAAFEYIAVLLERAADPKIGPSSDEWLDNIEQTLNRGVEDVNPKVRDATFICLAHLTTIDTERADRITGNMNSGAIRAYNQKLGQITAPMGKDDERGKAFARFRDKLRKTQEQDWEIEIKLKANDEEKVSDDEEEDPYLRLDKDATDLMKPEADEVYKMTPEQEKLMFGEDKPFPRNTKIGVGTALHEDDDDDAKASLRIFVNAEEDDDVGTHSVGDACELIEAFLDLEEPKLTWKMIDFISKDDITELLLSYLSRMKKGLAIDEGLVAQVDYQNAIALDLVFDRSADKVARRMKMSYALMKLLGDSSTECVKSFLLLKIIRIVDHALSVFHPNSRGNAFHACYILDNTMNSWPKSFFSALDKGLPKELFRCMLFRGLHRATAQEFLINLLSFQGGTNLPVKFKEIKSDLINLINSWEFMEHVVSTVGSGKVEDEVASGYCSFLREFFTKCATEEDAVVFVEGKEQVIVDTLIDAIADVDQTRTPRQRTLAAGILNHIMSILSQKNFVQDNPTKMAAMFGFSAPEPDPNYFHKSFKPAVNYLRSHIDDLCDCLCATEPGDPIPLAGGTVDKPFTPLRLVTMKLLVNLFTLTEKVGCPVSPGIIPGTCWDTFIAWVFQHSANNMYLIEFRKLFEIVCKERSNCLRFLLAECGLLNSMITFYTNNPQRVALHGFALDICWMVYKLTQPKEASGDDDESDSEEPDRNEQDLFDVANFLDFNDAWRAFFPILEKEMGLQADTKNALPVQSNPLTQLESLLQNLIQNSLINTSNADGGDLAAAGDATDEDETTASDGDAQSQV